jgi:drug/metabolite transporter (DMT)-like permease
MLVCSAMMSVPTALVMSGPPPVEMFLPANRLGLLQVIIGIGVFCTALAYPIYFKILALAGASNLSLVTIIIPVFAISLDAALLGQFVTSQEVMGFGLVVVGLAVMDGRILTLLGVRRG